MLHSSKKALFIGVGFFIFCFGIIPCATGLEDFREKNGGFVIDAAGFWENSEISLLEVYYSLPYSALQFVKRDDLYKARFDLSIVVYNAQGTQVMGDRWGFPVQVEDQSEIGVSFAYSQVRFQIPPGVYKIKAKVEDRHNKKSYAVEEETEIAPFPIEKFGLTQIQFAELIDPDSIETPFSKHGYRIAPNADRTFGENRADFFFYSELLSTPENYGDFRIDYRLSNEKDSLCVENGATISVNDPVTPFTGSADISNLKDGTYTLTLVAENLSDHEQHEKVVTHDEFSIVWSQISWGGDYKEAYRQILYIASDEELDGFKKLEDATDEERIDFLVRFWAKRDPIPRTPQNEYMQEHFRRLQYANEAFGSTIPGWRTDMGRIYIKFGEPDEIDRHPFNFDTAPYEIWLYYRCGYRFVFVDENGYGRYNMVEPSTEGTYSTECTNRAYE